jgi:hypothetical protein
MADGVWLIDESAPLGEAALRKLERELPRDRQGVLKGAQQVPNLAVRLGDLIIHDNQKWWPGEAEIRVDALVVHGNGTPGKTETFYQPRTFRFPRVKNGDRLPTGDGLLIFYGQPLFFLDVFLTVSRDKQRSDDLATLLAQQAQSAEMQAALGTLLGLGLAAPVVASVTAAVGAAAVLGYFAYQVLRKATGDTVGLYRTSHLQYVHNFGVGRHPAQGSYRAKDLSFWYEILIDAPKD